MYGPCKYHVSCSFKDKCEHLPLSARCHVAYNGLHLADFRFFRNISISHHGDPHFLFHIFDPWYLRYTCAKNGHIINVRSEYIISSYMPRCVLVQFAIDFALCNQNDLVLKKPWWPPFFISYYCSLVLKVWLCQKSSHSQCEKWILTFVFKYILQSICQGLQPYVNMVSAMWDARMHVCELIEMPNWM